MKLKVFGFSLLLLGFVSCDSHQIYDENSAVSESGWAFDDVKTFEIPVTDTMSVLNIYVNLRTSTDYPYQNIFLFMYSEYPDGYTDKDTLDLILAEPNGRWYGESSGTVVENRFLIAGGRFATPGNYIFKIQHAMQDPVLPEIIDVGMRVEIRED